MFLDFYKLKEQPFGVTPDPRFLYMSETHREALASLFYGVKSQRGFMALVAKPGMGKTSLLFRLMQNLEPNARTVFLFQTQCDSREFLKYLLADMGIQTDSTDLVKMHSQLNEVLAENARTGKQLVVIVDEAQNLDPSVLETIRLLSDFETSRQKLLQIVLSGQLQLADKLASPSLVQLSQRISMLSRLRPFSTEETSAYIQHRLSVAGYPEEQLFTPAAVNVIAELSQGIPRNINNLCFNALSWGYAVKKNQIDDKVIREVAADLSIFCKPEPAAAAEAVAPALVPARPATAPKAAETQPVAQAVEKKAAAIPVAPTAPLVAAAPRLAVPAPQREGHTARYVAMAAGLAIVAFLAGYGWQNYHRPAETAPSEVRADGTPSHSATVAPAKADEAPVNSMAKPGESPAASVASGAENPAPSGNMKSVLVKPNDTLWGLTQKYSISGASADNFRSITSLNNLSNPNHIEAGQRLLLPVESKSDAGAASGAASPATNTADSNAGASPRR